MDLEKFWGANKGKIGKKSRKFKKILENSEKNPAYRKKCREAADGNELVSNAGSELDGIVGQVTQINDMNFQIATASGQQSSVAEEMSQNLTNVRELVEASVVVVTELLETSEMMQNNAGELDKKIKSFQV